MVGTPVRPVIRSFSINSSALAGDQRYIRTSFMPPAIAGISTECEPVTWNSGTGSRKAACAAPAGGGGGGAPVRRTTARAAEKPTLIRLEMALRWVPSAPFGRPVVPEV